MNDYFAYPAGSSNWYEFPANIVMPDESDAVLVLHDGRTAVVPAHHFVLTRWGRHEAWLQASFIRDHPAGNLGYKWYLGVVDVTNPVQVEASAVTGTSDAAEEVFYNISPVRYEQVVAASEGMGAVNPVAAQFRETNPSLNGCSCVLTNTPCGMRIGAVLLPVGP